MAVTIGAFDVLGTLGYGAHSTILHIRRAADQRPYALKVVPIAGPDDRKFLDQAKHEFRVGQMLQHPNLIRIYACETTRDWLFRVRKAQVLIEYVAGKTLDQWPRLTNARLVDAFEKIASGLVHMHRRGVCHADLKPNNILLSRTGDLKVIDFGLAWIKGEPKGRVQGTPEYIAPEQAKESVVTEQTDVYNFGATAYRLLTGKLPPSVLIPGMTRKVFAEMLQPAIELMPNAPPALCDLIHRCLGYKPDHRPQRMIEVHAELVVLVESLVRSPDEGLAGLASG